MKSVSVELLNELAARVKPTTTAARKPVIKEGDNGRAFDVQTFIDRHGLEATGPTPWTSEDGKQGKRWILSKDPMGEGHDDNTCFILQFENGAVAAGCHHASATWNWHDLRNKYEPDRGADAKRKSKPQARLEPIVITLGELSITAEPKPPDSKGVVKTRLTARVGDRLVHIDALDLSSDRRRKDFVTAVKTAVPEIDEQTLATQLLQLVEQVDKRLDECNGDEGDGGDDEIGGIKKSAATRMVELATEAGGEFWHDPDLDYEAYATVPVGDAEKYHLENHRINSKRFRRWLQHKFHQESQEAPNAQAMQDAISTLAARALFAGGRYKAEVRIAAGTDGAIYIDLADDLWQCVRIDTTGWRLCSGGGPKFIRPKGMRPLPVPVKGGSLNLLWQYVNVEPADRPLVLAWLVGAMRPCGPYPPLGLHGEQGRAKSTTSRVVRSIFDPNVLPLRAEPPGTRDLAIAAYNAWILAFDNLSFVSPQLSDALCRMATGAGYAVRTHYENREEELFTEVRPILLNGITELATRPDLLDRSIVIVLPPVEESKRRTEADLYAAFNRDHPLILGALLDAIVVGLRNLPNVKLPCLPRMADFAIWATACEAGLGLQPGEFLEAYNQNRSDALASALEANVVAPPLMAFVQATLRWQGAATDLLRELGKRADPEVRRQSGWPRTPAMLSNILRRLAPPLRGMGYAVEFGRSHHPRTITLEFAPQTSSPPSPPSPVPPAADDPSGSAGANGDAGDDGDADSPDHSDRAAGAHDDSSPFQQPSVSIADTLAEMEAPQQAPPARTEPGADPDQADRRPNIHPTGGTPADPEESRDG